MKRTPAQILMGKHILEMGLGPIQYEYPFSAENPRWKADIYLPTSGILIECDGGKWHGGHKRGNALERDYVRSNTATIGGFRLLRFTNEQILSGEAKAWLERWVVQKGRE